MTSIKKILVDLDPTKEEQPALNRGIFMAKKLGASITLFLATYNRGLVSNLFFNSEELEAAKKGFLKTQAKWVNEYLKQVKDAKLEVDIDIVWAKPIYEAINKKAEEGNYDLVIKSTHNHPTINKIFFTPNDWQLLKTCTKPLILAKTKASNDYSNIMAAIDPSNRHEHSETLDPLILTAARDMAVQLDANAHAVHCYDPIAYQMWTDIGIGMGAGMGPADFSMGQDNYDKYLDQLKKDNQKTFDEAIGEVEFPTDRLHLEEGYPEQILPSIVENEKVDLLVMGTAYHSGLIGSTVEKILDEVNCDILAVRI